MNMKKLMWCRFEQCLLSFTMLLVKGSSAMELFRHLSNHVFGVRNLGNTEAMSVIFCFKMFKIEARFLKCSKKYKKPFFISETIAYELVSLY